MPCRSKACFGRADLMYDVNHWNAGNGINVIVVIGNRVTFFGEEVVPKSEFVGCSPYFG